MFKEFDVSNLTKAHIELKELLDDKRKKLEYLLAIKNKTYENFVTPFLIMHEKVGEFITPVFHIDSVKNSELTQDIYAKSLPL